MNKFDKKRIIFSLIVIVFVFVAVFFGINYYKWNKVVKAVGGMPFQFGGTVTIYVPKCVSDPYSGVCENCLMCTSPITGVGNYACNGYQEIDFAPAGGTPGVTNVCVPSGFTYSGGGAMPRVGGGIIGGGASNILPWVIGVSK